MSDFYDEAARQRYATLEAAKARVVANLEEYRAIGDEASAAEELQTLATLNDQQQSLRRLHQQYNAQRNPPQQEMSDAEFVAMSPERMAQNPAAIDRIFSKSKYYTPNQWSDPEVAKRAQAGVAEVERRRRRGE